MQEKYNKSSVTSSEAKMNEKVLDMLDMLNSKFEDMKRDMYDQKLMIRQQSMIKTPGLPKNLQIKPVKKLDKDKVRYG